MPDAVPVVPASGAPARSWRRRLRLPLACLVTLAGLATAAVAILPASAAAGTPLVASAARRCLEAVPAPAPVRIQDCDGGVDQSWELTATGELRVESNGVKCLDVPGQATAPGTAVQIYACNGQANQRWRINANGTITGVQSGLCLDVFERRTANNTPVQIFTCNGQTNQTWARQAADTQAPTPPGNARTSNLTCDSVTFAWNAATDNVAVAFYDIYHDGQQMTSVSGTTLSARLTVVPGATWGLYVNARDAAGNVSQASATVTITPPQCQVDTQPPTAPGNVQGTASGTTVNLTWTASTDNIRVSAYDVYRDDAKVGTVVGSGGDPAGTAFTDSGLAANTNYRYHVIARDAQANASPRSNTAAVRTGAACGSPVCAVTQVATDNDIPWGLVTLPDGNILYARRDAHDIVRLNPTTGAKTSIGKVPNVSSTEGEGGLLGIEISPSFATDNWLYIYHTSPTDNRIVRMKVTNGTLNTGSLDELVLGIARNKYHNGGRLRWGPDGKLYASTGDGQFADNAQNINNLAGKVLRINPDGTVPSDNPFGNFVWSYGHRNPQGLAFDSRGRLWEQEFGNSIMDETNLIQKGGNYGWPACEGTSGDCGRAGYIAPKATYRTADGSCSGITIVRDALYIACARGARMYRFEISGNNLANSRQYFVGTYGRLRTVEPAPGGGLWLTTTNNGDKDSIANNSNERIFRVALG